MIWKPCQLKAREKIEEDALRNPIYEWKTVMETKARFTPWTDEQIALDDRDVTKNEQRFIIPLPRHRIPECQRAEIDGIEQEITQLIDLSPRWTAIQVKVYKE